MSEPDSPEKDSLKRTEIDGRDVRAVHASEFARTRIEERSVGQIHDSGLSQTRNERGQEANVPQPAGRIAATPSESVVLSPGMRVQQFELIEELGRGGMGQVFLARDTKLGRLVAIKFLSLRSAELIERFLVEARSTARCNHENIVVIYEADEADGLPYMALEYLEGQPLSSLLSGHPLSPRRAVELIVPVVRALVRAHELGIVHRDLKPDNVFVTKTGQVKVLDFGIAKLFDRDEEAQRIGARPDVPTGASMMTQRGAILGTMPFMSPEQWGMDAVDHRTDIWAIGIILWEMLTGGHPVSPTTPNSLRAMAAMIDEPLQAIEQVRADIPAALAQIVDACLLKRKQQRIGSAAALLGYLEPLVPARFGHRLAADECPYPGMSAFQESDAGRFFGRSKDIEHLVHRMRQQALVGIVGSSGVGKSSLVRAGLVPALRASDDPWEVLVARPGRDPISALASLLQPLSRSTGTALETKMQEHARLTERLRNEPGFLGTLLRNRARQKNGKVLLFVDQFEELYTVVEDPADRRAYTSALAGVADDPSTPLRVVISMRSDLLDRVAENRTFMDSLTAGLLFLSPMEREGTRAALVEPLEMAGYQFETPNIVEDMLDSLEGVNGALPLLQFTAAKLWEMRDSNRRVLTRASYESLGGVAGALATHADTLYSSLAPKQQRLLRSIFQRLVTTDGTRAIADVSDLDQLSPNPGDVSGLIDHLVAARLLVVQRREGQEGGAVEIVHESLIASWPALRRWREEGADDSAFLHQLRSAAQQWDAKARPAGLLWRGEAMNEAKRFEERFRGELASSERRYLDAVVGLAERTTQRRRRLIAGAFVFLGALAIAALVALFWVRGAEKTAQQQREVAENEAIRAKAAEEEVRAKLETIEEQQETIRVRTTEREAASQKAAIASKQAATAETKQQRTYEELEDALRDAKKQRQRAEKAARESERKSDENRSLAKKADEARRVAETARAKEEKRRRDAERKLRALATELD